MKTEGLRLDKAKFGASWVSHYASGVGRNNGNQEIGIDFQAIDHKKATIWIDRREGRALYKTLKKKFGWK